MYGQMTRRAFLKAMGLGTAAVVCVGGTALGQARRPGAPGAKAFSDEAVGKAIKKGVDYLLKTQGADGSWPGFGGDKYPVGPSAIATYAILDSEVYPAKDARIKKALDWLVAHQAPGRLVPAGAAKKIKQGGGSSYCYKTYSLGLRANAFLAAVKRAQVSYKKYLRNDVAQLILSTKDGSYGYDSYANGQSSGDNSNSQYGVLGVWAGVQADMEVPRGYWYKVLTHWLKCQGGDGGWSYRTGASTATMTAAGLASMFLCYDNLLYDGFIRCDMGAKAQKILRPLNRGLDWMDKNFGNSGRRGIGSNYYLLYGVERVGLASGYKYFGKTDWYKVGADTLMRTQSADGSWPGGRGAVVSTAYALLFLAHGRHAILFNKLEFDGDWNNRPRDMAQLTRWIGRQFEESTVNWQIVNMKVQPEEWLDAPILYISGSKAPKFTDKQIAAVARYVNMGGTILSCAECDGRGFKDGIRAVYAKMFPKYKLEPVPRDHEFFTINFKLDSRAHTYLGLQMIHNGVRPLVIHTDRDLPKSWQLRLNLSDRYAFEGPANIGFYVTDKAVAEKTLAARGATTWPAELKYKPAKQVDVALLSYRNPAGKEGNCEPEPLAWERFARMMAQQYKVKVTVTKPMPIAKLAESGANVAVLAGTDRIAATADEVQALQAFVAGGGLLYMEAVGGAWANRNAAEFAESGDALAAKVAAGLPDTVTTVKRLRRLTLDSPLFAQKGLEIKKVSFRKFTKGKIGARETLPLLRGVLNEKSLPVILFSNEDLTAALVGYACYEVYGYTPESAFELMRNIVSTKAHAPITTQPATQPAGGATK